MHKKTLRDREFFCFIFFSYFLLHFYFGGGGGMIFELEEKARIELRIYFYNWMKVIGYTNSHPY